MTGARNAKESLVPHVKCKRDRLHFRRHAGSIHPAGAGGHPGRGRSTLLAQAVSVFVPLSHTQEHLPVYAHRCGSAPPNHGTMGLLHNDTNSSVWKRVFVLTEDYVKLGF